MGRGKCQSLVNAYVIIIINWFVQRRLFDPKEFNPKKMCCAAWIVCLVFWCESGGSGGDVLIIDGVVVRIYAHTLCNGK